MENVEKSEQSRSYAKHIVAFVDILGFKDLIDQVESGKLHYGFLNQCFALSEKLGRGNSKFTLMSDAVVISSKVADQTKPPGSPPRWKPPTIEDKISDIFSTLNFLSIMFLRMGIFVRGAITIGNLYHRGNIVFGDGLVKAYLLETKKAKFPRIIVSPELLPFVPPAELRRLGDEHPFLHILAGLEEIQSSDKATQKYHRNAFVQMRKTIQTGLKETAKQPGVFEKIHWFAEYWNSCCPNLPRYPSKIKL